MLEVIFMSIKLTKRQNKIIDILKKANRPISANDLAERLSVSLRTIRYDLNEIDVYAATKYSGIALEKVPGVGITISKTGKGGRTEPVAYHDFINFSDELREYIIVFLLSMSQTYLTSEQISELLDVSKSTVVNQINKCNDTLTKHHLRILGRRKYGYKIVGSERSLFNYFIQKLKRFSQLDFSKMIFSESENLGILYDENDLNHICKKIIDVFHCVIMDIDTLFMILLIILHRNHLMFELNPSQYLESPPLINKLESCIEQRVHPQLQSIFIYVINRFTDYIPTNDDETVNVDAIDGLIGAVSKRFPAVMSEKQNLRSDLINHFRLTLNRIELGINENNELLSQIKVKYYEMFETIKENIHILESAHNMYLSEDEIGFMTLYFVRAIDKHNETMESNVLIICNTGRGAAKLLSSRFINNIPEVHVLGIGAPEIIDNFMKDNQEIHLIISTIPLDNDLRHIVVSPLLSAKEIQHIRDALYEIRKNNIRIDNSVDFSGRVIIKSNKFNDANAEETAEIILETVLLYDSIKIQDNNLNQLAGMLTHITMSIPRWYAHQFILTNDFENYAEKYPYQVHLIREYLKKIERIIEVSIPLEEAFAILRYIVY